jgi:ferredoxin
MTIREKEPVIIFCRCTAGIISHEKLDAIAGVVKSSGSHVVEVNDLCAMSIDKAAELRELNRRFSGKTIVACYPRAVRNILNQAGAPFDDLTVLNFRKMSPGEIGEKLSAPGQNTGTYERMSSEVKVPAWFPVVEKERCTHCGQCARFCLFGVYRYSDKKLSVLNPLNCKNNCPACARSCPVSAIIFPRIKEDGAIAGAEPDEIRMAPEQKGPLFARLQQRGEVRRNIFRNNLLELAEEERRRAIEEYKKQKS